jgi:PAS domain S-box-containing protein
LRQAEEALRESEQRYRTLFEKANDAIFLENERDDIVDANERACTLLGYSRDELLKMRVPDLQAPEVRGQVGRVIRERIETHGSGTFETVDLHRSGRRIPVEVTISEISHRGEKLVLSIVRDITERKRIEAELRARQELLDLAQKAARAVAFDWHIGARESANRWSPELEAMYGLEPGTFDGTYQGWKELVHPDDWPAVKVAISRAHESGDVAAEYRVIHKDGTVRWLRAKGRMFFDAKGQPERMVGFMFDVTDWRHAEEALRASEARFRTFADHAMDAFFLHDEQLTVIDVNRQACASLGYRREELIGSDPRDFDADLDETSIARLADRVGAGETVTFETRHRRKDGGVFPVEIRVRQFQEGERRFHVALARDISERKRTEKRMLAQHTVAQILADAAMVDDAMPRLLEAVCECLDWDLGTLWRVDREAGVLRCAQVWRKAFLDAAQFETATRESTFEPGVGLPGRVWVARAPACIPDVVHEANFLRGSIAADAGLHAAFAFPILLRGEVLGVIDLLSRDVRQPDQELLDMMASLGSQIGQFIERKRAEDALRAAQSEVTHLARVMTMGELAASIAHEVNQPIAAAITDASTCVRWLTREAPDLDEARQAAQRTVKDASRAADIITRIRRLFKRSGLDAEPVNVNDVVEELITLLRREALQSGVSITTALAPDLPLVMGDRVQLQQVLLNLLMNSLEATKGVRDRREITVTSRRADGDQVHVAVTDTGVGLPPTGADELFKAFFTTKAGGTGMGLAISRSIIEAHGGRLWAASNADRGATFTFTLHIAQDAHA